MNIKKLTNKIYYFPHEVETDRPMIAYIKGKKYSLAIDAGYSEKHIDDFYNSLEKVSLKKPDFTVITHWHYDHTFGMHYIHGISIAHKKTNAFLKEEQKKAYQAQYIDVLKQNDACFEKEYHNETKLNIVLSDIQFEKEIYLNLGEITAHVFHTESPHSEDTVCIYIPEEKALFLGDATSEDFFNNGYMDNMKLQNLIRMIEKTDCIYCILSQTKPLMKQELLYYLYGLIKNNKV